MMAMEITTTMAEKGRGHQANHAGTLRLHETHMTEMVRSILTGSGLVNLLVDAQPMVGTMPNGSNALTLPTHLS